MKRGYLGSNSTKTGSHARFLLSHGSAAAILQDNYSITCFDHMVNKVGRFGASFRKWKILVDLDSIFFSFCAFSIRGWLNVGQKTQNRRQTYLFLKKVIMSIKSFLRRFFKGGI
jgi:hypothetical protein